MKITESEYVTQSSRFYPADKFPAPEPVEGASGYDIRTLQRVALFHRDHVEVAKLTIHNQRGEEGHVMVKIDRLETAVARLLVDQVGVTSLTIEV